MSRRQKDLFPDLPDGKKYVSDIPELIAEWHPTKNEGLVPEDISFGSGITIWWQCSHGHEWSATANTRTNLKSGCPECGYIRVANSRSLASLDYNLLIVNPELCREWHPRNKKPPSEYYPKSSKKVWWQCAKDTEHVWQARIASRTDLVGNTLIGCPFCSGKKASRNYNLLIERPELLSEWSYESNQIKPTQLTPNSHTKVWWRCEKGHEWLASPHNRRNGTGCPHCTHQTSRPEIRILTELMSIYENVISRHKLDGYELDIYLPDLCVGIEYDGAFWHQDKAEKDKKKQQHVENLGNRLLRVREAPLPRISEADLIVNPRIELTKDVLDKLASAIGGDQKKIEAYVNRKTFVNQELFHTYLDYFPSPFPEKSLATLKPELGEEWHPTKNLPLTPANFTANSGHKVWWQCEKGHEWQTTIDRRNSKRGGSGCPYCSPTYKRASQDNNLAVKYPQLLKFFHPTKNAELTPEKVTHGSEIPIWWQCPADRSHEFLRSPNHMTSSRAKELCPYCRGTLVSETNCMYNTHPEMAKMFHPTFNGYLNPKKIRATTRKTLWWRCDNGHEWQATGSAMQRRANLCQRCKTK